MFKYLFSASLATLLCVHASAQKQTPGLTSKSEKINVPFKELTLEDAITILETCDPVSNSLLRHISSSLSIRKGKYGDYIFYKNDKMKKPQFLKLEGFNTKSDTNYLTCCLDALKLWIKEKYGV